MGGSRYVDYDNAMKTEHPSTPLWVVASTFSKNLFGEVQKDAILQMKMLTRIGLFVEHFGKTIEEYEIE